MIFHFTASTDPERPSNLPKLPPCYPVSELGFPNFVSLLNFKAKPPFWVIMSIHKVPQVCKNTIGLRPVLLLEYEGQSMRRGLVVSEEEEEWQLLFSNPGKLM